MTVLLAALALTGTPALEPPIYRHPGCRTHRCDRRMTRKAHRKTVRRWTRTARPYAGWLHRVRMCESGGNYRTATGNGFWGAYQFTLSSWRSVGGVKMPHAAEPAEQDFRAVRLLWVQGRGAWPVCG